MTTLETLTHGIILSLTFVVRLKLICRSYASTNTFKTLYH